MGLYSLSMQRPLLLLSSRPWNQELADRLSISCNCCVSCISSPGELTLNAVEAVNPKWIFVPHWSHLIPEKIWGQWPTVIFHMSDLPYGRGGSPLQNLIKRGNDATMLTALLCGPGLDDGLIYIKRPLSLLGSAEEVFLRADRLIEEMIVHIVQDEPIPRPQQGNPVLFRRRTPDQSNLLECPEADLTAWFDHIRMLDAQGYPHAFLEVNGLRLEFRRVTRRSDGLYADVRISSVHPPHSEVLHEDSYE